MHSKQLLRLHSVSVLIGAKDFYRKGFKLLTLATTVSKKGSHRILAFLQVYSLGNKILKFWCLLEEKLISQEEILNSSDNLLDRLAGRLGLK